MLRSSSTKAIVGMSLLSKKRCGRNGELSSDAPHQWASNAVYEQCKLG
jgi:hypothetical protein